MTGNALPDDGAIAPGHGGPGLRRMQGQRVGERDGSVGELVEWMGAMQAQDWGQAKWAVGVRTGVTDAEVEAAVERGDVVRTWPMRGTLHLVPGQDARWMVELMSPRVVAGAAQRLRALELDEGDVARATEVIAKALEEPRIMTRGELMRALDEEGFAASGSQRGYHLLWRAAQAGVIACGPTRGKSQTFVLLDAWCPGQRTVGREEALATIAGRYFQSHGPATLQDFAWWTGLTMADARLGLDGAKAGLANTAIDGKEYWSDAHAEDPRGATGTWLLPGFDEFLLGYRDRSAVLPAEHADRVVPGANGVFKPIVVVDGRVVGTWTRSVSARGVVVEVEGFDGAIADAREQAEAYARFVGAPLRGAVPGS